MNKKLHAYLMLLLVTIIWGATFPVIHYSVQRANPLLFVLIRFAIAGVVLLCIMGKSLLRRDIASLKFGVILGLVNGGTFVLQTTALQSIDSSRTAFLTATYIIMVPLLLPLFGFRKPTFGECSAALVCLFGVYIMSGASISGIQLGDLLVILSALFIAVGIIIVEYAAKYTKSNSVFNFYQIIFTTILPAIMLAGKHIVVPQTINFWLSVSYCAVFATAIAFLVQVKYQSVVGASKTALILSLESVFASIFAWFSGEVITRQIIIGGGVILLSTILVDIIHILKPKKLTNN